MTRPRFRFAPAIFRRLLAVLLLASTSAIAQDAARCLPTMPGCARYAHQISIPANALSRGPSGAFDLQPRGLDWLGASGTVTLTVRRPKDYAGGRVRVTYFYQVMTDEGGTLGFTVTPMTFNSGNSFETYGALATGTRAAPEDVTTLLSSSVTIPPGSGWGDGAWWYIEAQRRGASQGGFPGRLRLMSVAIEY